MNKIILIPLRAVQIAFGGIGAISLSVICLLNEMVNQLQRNDELDPPEPKPLLADAKVGDLCQRRSGNYVQIREHNPDIHESDRFYFTDGLGSVDVSGMAMDRPTRFDIIHTEPLAEVGSAEWALQQMKLGNKVIWRGEKIGDYDPWPFHIYEGGMIGYGQSKGYIGHIPQNEWLMVQPAYKKTGWQLYEEPAFKVGDWVDCGRIAGHGRIDQINEAGKIHVEMTDGEHAEWFMPDGSNTYSSNAAPYSELRIIRKLDPSEVIIKVTLEGTVMPGANESMFELSNRAGGWNTLGFNAIDPETAALVRELLKAQGGSE